ncbi:unnamed protein product [Effrenium voratum]|uniref:Alpha/beta hydrolase fold-3 domain-containing protein n=1 Tax=Effrenium voratum TaxID=2562239 RepID=A0AA36HTB4_9DINO|nr:unnamed protein product [Effrenium voratum]
MVMTSSFRAALGLLRQSMRSVPRAMLAPETLATYLQPVTNSVGFPAMLLPSGVDVELDTVGGVQGEWLLPAEASEDLLVWAHGGGFAFCSPGTHRQFLARVAARTKCAIFCPNYRKPPRHTFPEPGLDVWKAYGALRSKRTRMFLGGDSAGGNLALQVARREPKTVAGLVLLSPWVDLADVSSSSWTDFRDIDFIPAEQSRLTAELYAGEGVDLEDPELSPARQESWPEGFPPVLLEYAGAEVFRSQIERLCKVLKRSGVEVVAHCEERQVHVYPILDFFAPDPVMSEGFFARLEKFVKLRNGS